MQRLTRRAMGKIAILYIVFATITERDGQRRALAIDREEPPGERSLGAMFGCSSRGARTTTGGSAIIQSASAARVPAVVTAAFPMRYGPFGAWQAEIVPNEMRTMVRLAKPSMVGKTPNCTR